ncbi:uncharacterized protein LOC144447740 [Glandiceps talaboti]
MSNTVNSSCLLRILVLGVVIATLVEATLSAKPSNMQWLYTTGKKRAGENDVTSGDEDLDLSKGHAYLLPQPPVDQLDAKFLALSDETVGVLIKRLPPFWRQFVLQMIRLGMYGQRNQPEERSQV